MKISVCQVGFLHNNCYLIEDEKEKAGWLIDPGDEPLKIKAMAEERHVKINGVLITHAHFDHIGAAAWAAEQYECPIFISGPEAEEAKAGGVFKGHVREVYQEFLPALECRGKILAGEEMLVLGTQRWKTICVPGHSPAGLCFYNADEGVLAAGDTLFRESIGRTDTYQGNQDDLKENIRKTLLTLPEDVVVLPGHGPTTTIGWEKEHNPYL